MNKYKYKQFIKVPKLKNMKNENGKIQSKMTKPSIEKKKK